MSVDVCVTAGVAVSMGAGKGAGAADCGVAGLLTSTLQLG